jgi:hypothetical protein
VGLRAGLRAGRGGAGQVLYDDDGFEEWISLWAPRPGPDPGPPAARRR